MVKTSVSENSIHRKVEAKVEPLHHPQNTLRRHLIYWYLTGFLGAYQRLSLMANWVRVQHCLCAVLNDYVDALRMTYMMCSAIRFEPRSILYIPMPHLWFILKISCKHLCCWLTSLSVWGLFVKQHWIVLIAVGDMDGPVDSSITIHLPDQRPVTEVPQHTGVSLKYAQSVSFIPLKDQGPQ